MSKVRNATDGARWVPFLDREVGPGGEAEVPDAQPDGSPLVWPPPTWEYVRDDRAPAPQPSAPAVPPSGGNGDDENGDM